MYRTLLTQVQMHVSLHMTAVNHVKTAVDHVMTAVNHVKTAVNHHKTRTDTFCTMSSAAETIPDKQ